MKKVFFSLMIVFAMATAAVAQPRAIGARLGGNLEFSYQHSLAQGNMMVDLTAGVTNVWNNWAHAGVTAMFDWVWAIGASNWNWYVGPGVGVGFNYGRYWKDYDYLPVTVAVGAQIGVEYQFGIPLNISLDWRPMFNVLGFFRGHEYPFYNNFYSVALGLRYRF
ncbi:MAG: hypothetical protein J6T13_05415 [Bacteroidales bacterium]|nr:hypothetical protein [Bacteroidales bacterium]MBO7648965.1 hypothetical protein [Bacteroidales bacterium]